MIATYSRFRVRSSVVEVVAKWNVVMPVVMAERKRLGAGEGAANGRSLLTH